jgi:hypothetical protein
VTPKTILGIDPGAHGTIAALDESGDLLEVVDMPSTPEANGRTATNAPLFAGIFARSHARVAFCESVGGRPTDAKVAAFAFGRARGVIVGCAGALGLPIVFLTPPTWKRVETFRPELKTRIWRASERSHAGRLEPISSPASATSTAPRPASLRLAV